MTRRFLYIIACFLLSVFAFKEVIADIRFIHAETKSICDNCEAGSAERSAEERGFEEQKLPVEAFSIQNMLTRTQPEKTIYKAPYIPAIHTGIITPPPKA